MAFPTYEAREADPHNLQPFHPNRMQPRPFLFRVDHQMGENAQRAMILVQSNLEPDWEYGFHNARDFLAAPPETKSYHPDFHQGMELAFRILVNPSVKSSTYKSINPASGQESKQGKRIALTWDKDTSPEVAIGNWFKSKTSQAGFTIDEIILKRLAWISGTKMITDERIQPTDINYHRLRFRSALLDGTLKVTDPDTFKMCVENGIGSGKGMGLGLLSVIPLPK